MSALASLSATVLAVTCLAVLAVGVVDSADHRPAAPFSYLAVFIGVFAAVGLVLLLDRRDLRVVYAGTFVLLAAVAFARSPLARYAASALPGAAVAELAKGLALEAFSPLLVWLLVRTERADEEPSPIVLPGLIAAFVVGSVLMAINVAAATWTLVNPAPPSWLEPWRRDVPGSLFYPVLIVVGLIALLAAPARRWRRRSHLVALGAVALTPPILAQLAAVVELRTGITLGVVGSPWEQFLYIPLLALPLGLFVELLPPPSADGALRAVGVVLRPAALIAVGGTAGAILLGALLRNRERAVGAALSDPIVVLSLLLAAICALLISARTESRRLVARFSHPHLERTRRRLALLPRHLHGCRSPADVARLLAAELREGLEVSDAALFLTTQNRRELVDAEEISPPLASAGPLARRLSATGTPLAVDPSAAAFQSLPAAERRWLVDTEAGMLVPLTAPDDTLMAVLVLRRRPDGRRWLREERELATELIETAGPILDVVMRRHGSSLGATGPPAARVCPDCGDVDAASRPHCRRCDGELVDAPIPQLLPGRLRFETRLATRESYQLFRARDLSLGRPVAVRVRPTDTPARAVALRREARFAARVSHPHLETVYGIETWRGTPMLVLELLEGRILADRLDAERHLPLREALAAGIALAEALEVLHDAGIVHGGISPRSVGYGRDGTVKLIDLAHARFDDEQIAATNAVEHVRSTSTPSRRPHEAPYRPPETATGPRRTSIAADLWALSATLFHAVTGRPPYVAEDLGELLARMRREPVPRTSDVLAGAPTSLDDYFDLALHRQIDRRPQSAADIADRLRDLERKLFG